MKKYRIVKLSTNKFSGDSYIVQKRFLFLFWITLNEIHNNHMPKIFKTMYSAEYYVSGLKVLDGYKKKSVEKYL